MDKPKYRTLWTWDYATYWDNSFFARGKGSTGPSVRRDAFLEDYKRMVDYSAKHHFNGIVIWGAVRAHQDGFAQLKELVKYGREKGVRILPGVSAFSYGGVCYDPRTQYSSGGDYPMPNHPYSMNTWLQKHPEYLAVQEDGTPYEFGPLSAVACPSRRETMEWFKEGLNWLYEEFDVDGIQVEVGDYAVCHCPLCQERRKDAKVDQYFCVSDMVETYTDALKVSYAAKPDAWVICESYCSAASPNLPETVGWRPMDQSDREILSCLSEKAIMQWGVDKSVGGYAKHVWPEKVYTPTKENILRIHAGSQHSQYGPADWGANLVWEMVKTARTHGLNGVSVFGEESPFSPPNEANYLAMEEAAGFGNDNPNCDEELFYRQTLDPLYGGSDMAKRWRQLYIKGRMLQMGEKLNEASDRSQPVELLTDDPDFRQKALTMSNYDKVKELEKYHAEARAISSKLSGEACGRWDWLQNNLWNQRYLVSTK